MYMQKNGGPSKARNKGLDEAEGDYIAFLDSDDYLHEEYLNIINNDINKFVIKNSIYIVNGSPNDPQCTFSLYL